MWTLIALVVFVLAVAWTQSMFGTTAAVLAALLMLWLWARWQLRRAARHRRWLSRGRRPFWFVSMPWPQWPIVAPISWS